MSTKIHPQKPHKGLDWRRENHITYQVDEKGKKIQATVQQHPSISAAKRFMRNADVK